MRKFELVEALSPELGASSGAPGGVGGATSALEKGWKLLKLREALTPCFLDVQSNPMLKRSSCWCSLGRSPRN